MSSIQTQAIDNDEQPSHLLHRVEKKILSLSIDKLPSGSVLGKAIKHQLSAGGKRTRAWLSLQINEILGIPAADSVALAAICELLHQASLIHDDLHDKQSRRRGRLSVWKQFGENCALCAGDMLISAAYAAIGQCTNTSNHQSLLAITHDIVTKVIDGQLSDIESRIQSLTLANYEKIVMAKSGGLLTLPLELAITYQNADNEQCLIRDFFQNYALVYQALDDMQDYQQDWLAADSVKSPNILALMLQVHKNRLSATRAIYDYIDELILQMQKVHQMVAPAWNELLSSCINTLNDSYPKKKSIYDLNKQSSSAVVLAE